MLVTKIDRLARSTSDLYRIISRVKDDPSIDITFRIGRLVMGILALIAEFKNDIRRERQMDGIKKTHERVRFGPVSEMVRRVRKLRKAGQTLPEMTD